MATYNHKIEISNGNTTDVFHPETNSSQVYDFTNQKWLNEMIGQLSSLSTNQKSSLVGAINEIANRATSPSGGTIPDASTTTKGIVKLNNTLTSDLIDEAITAAKGKELNDKITNVTTQLDQVESKVVDKVSILEFEHLKGSTSEGEDWQPVFQHIVDTYGGNVEIIVPYRPTSYKFSKKVLVPAGQTFVMSSDNFFTTLTAMNSFTDEFLFELQGGHFDLSYITLAGHGKDGLTLFGAAKGNYGGYRIKKIRLYTAEYGLRFDGTSEFPLGGQMEDVWAYNFNTCAIKFASDTPNPDGQSCHEYNNIRLNNNQIKDRATHTASNITVTSGTTSDTVTWTNENAKSVGWVIMRRPTQTTNQQAWVPLTYVSSATTSYTANKASGTSWDYAVVRRTIGMHTRHLKGVTFGTLQTEYYGTGYLCEKGQGITIGSFYNEWRANTSSTNPIANGDGIFVDDTNGFTLLSAWQEYGRNVIRIKYSSGTFVTGVRGNNVNGTIIFYEGHTYNAYHSVGTNHPSGSTPAVIGDDGSVYSKAYIAANPKHGYTKTGQTDGHELVVSSGVKSRLIAQYRGGSPEGILEASGSGSTLSVNNIVVTNNSKNVTPPLYTTMSTTISERNVATPVLNIAVAGNAVGLLMFNFSVEVIGSGSVSRHIEGGTLKIAVMRSSNEAIKYKIDIEDKISLTEAFATTASGELDATTGNLIVKMAVENSWMSGGSARFKLVPISSLKNSGSIVVTQL